MAEPTTHLTQSVTDTHAKFEKFWADLPQLLKEKANKAVAKLAYATGREHLTKELVEGLIKELKESR